MNARVVSGRGAESETGVVRIGRRCNLSQCKMSNHESSLRHVFRADLYDCSHRHHDEHNVFIPLQDSNQFSKLRLFRLLDVDDDLPERISIE